MAKGFIYIIVFQTIEITLGGVISFILYTKQNNSGLR